MDNNILFEEKQYLGYNKYSNVFRMLLGIFCFLAYFWSDNKYESADILFAMGIVILVISALLMLVLHLHTIVIKGSIILDGLWTARRVKIDLSSIASIRAIPSRHSIFRRPVYNLHRNGTIRFYTRGAEAVELIDKDGLRYTIGSQMSGQLVQILQQQINKLANQKKFNNG